MWIAIPGAQVCTKPASPNPLLEFPKNFVQGKLDLGIDCLNIHFKKDGTFVYKFTGDCKGWGRKLHGTWKKEGDRIIFQATMHEGPSEEHDQCAGSYYQKNTPREKDACIRKYRSMIRKELGTYPAILSVQGHVRLDEKKHGIVFLRSMLLNHPQKKTVRGLLQIENDSFGEFTDLE